MENKKFFINQKSFKQSQTTEIEQYNFQILVFLSHFSNIISKNIILMLLHLKENNKLLLSLT